MTLIFHKLFRLSAKLIIKLLLGGHSTRELVVNYCCKGAQNMQFNVIMRRLGTEPNAPEEQKKVGL